MPSQTRVGSMSLVEPSGRQRSDRRYLPQFVDRTGPQGLPLVKPPWARITAIDLNEGEIVWQVPLGDGPRDHLLWLVWICPGWLFFRSPAWRRAGRW